MITSKVELRSQLRAIRDQVSSDMQSAAADAMCDNVYKLDVLNKAKNIAAYWPNDGEISTLPLLNKLLQQHKNCFLPVLLLDPRQQLAFASYDHNTPLLKNRYGICEPDLNAAYVCTLADLDIVFVPLVGFDKYGRRLGRGGGFYDATFSNLHQISRNKWPQLIGLAYECQKIDEIPADSWDWRLDIVVTEKEILRFN